MTMRKRFNLVGQIPLITLVALCVVTALLTGRFLSPLNLTNILVQSSIMAVIAIGMTFVIVGGGFDLSVGSTVALGRLRRRDGDGEVRHRGGRGGRHRGRRRGRPRQRPRSSPSSASIRSSPRSAPWCWCAASSISSPAARRSATTACRRPSSPSAPGVCSASTIWSGCRPCCSPSLSFVMHMTPYGRRIYATGGNREAAYLSGVPVERIVASTYVWCGGACRASPASCWRRGCNPASPPPANSTS